jgi:hypothetical protein
MRLYHVTDVAEAILREGFRDGESNYGLAKTWLKGVFVSDEPLTVNEGVKGEQVLEVTLSDETSLVDYELVQELNNYREWCVPAELLNRGHVRLLSEPEVDELLYPELEVDELLLARIADHKRTWRLPR